MAENSTSIQTIVLQLPHAFSYLHVKLCDALVQRSVQFAGRPEYSQIGKQAENVGNKVSSKLQALGGAALADHAEQFADLPFELINGGHGFAIGPHCMFHDDAVPLRAAFQAKFAVDHVWCLSEKNHFFASGSTISIFVSATSEHRP